MDGKTVVKLLKQAGWEHISTHGSHFKLKKPNYLPIVIPVHGKKDLKPGLLNAIEKATGVKFRKGF